MRKIEDLQVSDRDWSFREDGLTKFLSNAGRSDNEQLYRLIEENDNPCAKFKMFGGGRLLENDALEVYFILNQQHSNNFFLVSAVELRTDLTETS